MSDGATSLDPTRKRSLTPFPIRAGCSIHSADNIGSQLLGKSEVQAAICECQLELWERVQIRQEQMLAALTAIAFADMADNVETDEAGERPLPYRRFKG